VDIDCARDQTSGVEGAVLSAKSADESRPAPERVVLRPCLDPIAGLHPDGAVHRIKLEQRSAPRRIEHLQAVAVGVIRVCGAPPEGVLGLDRQAVGVESVRARVSIRVGDRRQQPARVVGVARRIRQRIDHRDDVPQLVVLKASVDCALGLASFDQ
jgi:hypothetical protein